MILMTHLNISPRSLLCAKGIKPVDEVVQRINVVVMRVDAVKSTLAHSNKVQGSCYHLFQMLLQTQHFRSCLFAR